MPILQRQVSHYFLLSFTMTTEYFSHHLKLVNARNTMSRLCCGLCIDWQQVDLISTNPTKAPNSLPFKTLQHGFWKFLPNFSPKFIIVKITFNQLGLILQRSQWCTSLFFFLEKQTNRKSNQFEYFSFLQDLLPMSYSCVLNDCFFQCNTRSGGLVHHTESSHQGKS